MNKEVRSIVKQLKAQGCDVLDSGRHNKVYKDGSFRYSLVKTPSDHRSIKNTVADLRRLGLLPRKT